MADGRDIHVWDNHAEECREANRELFVFKANTDDVGGWLRDRVVENLLPGLQCIDVGCGPGYWRNLFTDHHYTGFDQSTGMLKLAGEIPGSLLESETWVNGNARQVADSFPEKKFDMAFTASVLQHNRHEPDKAEIVRGIHSILKENGYLLCTENTFREDNCPQSVGDPTYTDGYTFTPEGWKTFMEELGFEFIIFNGKSEYLFKKR